MDAAAGRLTGDELLVLQLLARGYSRAQIAELLGVDSAAVAQTLNGAIRTLGATDAAGAIRTARRLDLIR